MLRPRLRRTYTREPSGDITWAWYTREAERGRGFGWPSAAHDFSGTTAVVTVTRGNDLIVGNIGDSRISKGDIGWQPMADDPASEPLPPAPVAPPAPPKGPKPAGGRSAKAAKSRATAPAAGTSSEVSGSR